MVYWSAEAKTASYATLRMLVQLLLIGYVLVYIFETDQPAIICAVLLFMLIVSSWIAIRHVHAVRRVRFVCGNLFNATQSTELTPKR